MAEALLKATLPLVDGGRLVDLFCGIAPAAGLLAPRVAAYVGQDPHAESVRQARSRWADTPAAGHMTFACLGLEDLARQHFGDFDTARVPEGLAERLPDPRWMRFLQVLRPALKPGGRVLVPALDAGWWGHVFRSTDSRLPEVASLAGTGISVRSLAHHTHLLERSGYVVSATYRVGLPGFRGRALLVATRVV